MKPAFFLAPKARSFCVACSGCQDSARPWHWLPVLWCLPWAVVEVSDDGCGMAPEVLARVFEPFFTTKLGQGGSGLGLSISHNIVTQVLGGELSVQSQPGRGAVFTIDIPLRAPDHEGGLSL